jgi:hypothetical protein
MACNTRARVIAIADLVFASVGLLSFLDVAGVIGFSAS